MTYSICLCCTIYLFSEDSAQMNAVHKMRPYLGVGHFDTVYGAQRGIKNRKKV